VTETDLLREVLACPDEDAPRLALADFLDENAGSVECDECVDGDVGCSVCEGVGIYYDPPYSLNRLKCPHCTDGLLAEKCPTCFGTGRVSDGKAERASFIRCQIELAAMHCTRHLHSSPCRPLGPGGAGGPFELCESLRRREEELFSAAAAAAMRLDEPLWGILPEWSISGHSPNVLRLVHRRWESHPELRLAFRRGFVHRITCTAADFLAHAGSIFAAQPVREVTLSDVATPRPVDGERARHFFLEKDMPSPIFRLLRTQDYFGGWKRFPSSEAARAALSAACVAYGRERVGVGEPQPQPQP
jgi:uncharacterized protein (TIGR02996 family)